MASLRGIKNDIDYLVSEVISDCYMALYFNDQSKREGSSPSSRRRSISVTR